jgi:hypothetical protein
VNYDKELTKMKCQFFPLNNDINARQPETRAVMNWLREIQFAASASLHGVMLRLLFFHYVTNLVKAYTYHVFFLLKNNLILSFL